jgi:hypothetical protein
MATPVLASSPEDTRFPLLGTFSSDSLEQAYRARYLPGDLWLARACVLAAVVRILLGGTFDYYHLQPSSFWFTFVCRVAFVLLSILTLVQLRPAGRLFFAWCLLLGTLTTYFVSLRVSTHPGQVYLTIGIVLAAYLLVPLPLARQMFAAIPFSIAVCVILMGTDQSAALTLGAAFLLAHTLGIAISWQRNHQRRLALVSGLQEDQLRGELQQALAEVKTLRGHISICAWCKSVRDERNAWLPVESYVEQHTHAEFTHGICPICVRQELGHKTALRPQGEGVTRV